MPASLPPLPPPLLFHLCHSARSSPPLPPPLSLLSKKVSGRKTFMTIHFHSMRNINTHCAIPIVILSVGYVCECLSAKSCQLQARTAGDASVSPSSSSPPAKYSSCRTLCARLVLKWIAYHCIGRS